MVCPRCISTVSQILSDLNLDFKAIKLGEVELISKIKPLTELNIGHFIIGESVFDGLDCVIKRFRAIINNQRKNF